MQMTNTLLLDTMLSVPLSALLSYLMRRRYQCSRPACGLAFLLGAYIALMFSATGLTPTRIVPADLQGLLSRLQPLQRLKWNLPLSQTILRTLGNLVLMAPFALLTCLLFPEHRALGRQLLLALGLSLLIEGLQVLLGRETDVIDLLLNTAGAGLGYLAYRLIRRRFPEQVKRLEVRGTECILYSYVLSALMLLLIAGAFRMAA
jgi:VanZ family protein